MIPITTVRFGAEEEALLLEVIRSGQLAQGPMVARFEATCAEMAGTSHAVAVNNGTTALVLAIEALQLRPGDEVITSPFTFVATLNAILEAGATARFADIGDDFNIDPAAIEPVLGERTRVLMPVHLYGLAADMAGIAGVAHRRDLAIVEDAAQAHAASFGGQSVGSWGLGCFSFYATKNITTGEGGVITTNNDALADGMRMLRNQGMRQRYQYEVAGHNYRLTDLQAAIALPQFARMDTIISGRRANAAYLNEHLAGIEGLVLPSVPEGREHVWHQYTVRVEAGARTSRDGFVSAMNERGVGCGVYYPKVVFDYDCYRSHPRVVQDDVPRAFATAGTVASLPVHSNLSASDLEQIVAAVREVLA